MSRTPAERIVALQKMAGELRREPIGKPIKHECELDALIDERRGKTMRSVQLTADDASIIKGMLARGDKQQDIAAWFGVNPARIVEIKRGRKFPDAPIAPDRLLPPPGPRGPNGAAIALNGSDPATVAEVRELLRSFDTKWTHELSVTAHERRETNEKLDRLTRRFLDLARHLNLIERPATPKISRRQPMAG